MPWLRLAQLPPHLVHDACRAQEFSGHPCPLSSAASTTGRPSTTGGSPHARILVEVATPLAMVHGASTVTSGEARHVAKGRRLSLLPCHHRSLKHGQNRATKSRFNIILPDRHKNSSQVRTLDPESLASVIAGNVHACLHKDDTCLDMHRGYTCLAWRPLTLRRCLRVTPPASARVRPLNSRRKGRPLSRTHRPSPRPPGKARRV